MNSVFAHVAHSSPGKSARKAIPWYVWALSCLIIWAIWDILSPGDRKFLPSSENIALLIFSFVLSRTIKDNYVRWIFTAWNIWPIIGSISLVAVNAARIGLNYNVDSSLSTTYYLTCVILAEIGSIIPQLIIKRKNTEKKNNVRPHILVIAFLAISPFLFVISVVRGTGDIPLISGRDLSSLMYEEDYGFFYRIAIYLSVSAIFFWININSTSEERSKLYKYLTIAFIIFILICSMASGKRAFAMYAIFGIVLFNLSRSISMTRLIQASLAGFVGILLYLFTASLRSGLGIERAISNWYLPFISMGVEYRDYTYTFNVFSRSSVLSTGYDWLGSTLCGLFPSFILSLMGINKDVVSKLDSARSLAKMFHTDLGIRIGLPGEIWFAYGWWGCILFVPFGALIAWASYRTRISENNISKSIWLTVISLFGLSILNQSTVTFGALLTLLYLGLFNELLQVRRRTISRPGARVERTVQ